MRRAVIVAGATVAGLALGGLGIVGVGSPSASAWLILAAMGGGCFAPLLLALAVGHAAIVLPAMGVRKRESDAEMLAAR